MQARGAACIEPVEAVIERRMSARSGSDDSGGSLGDLAAQLKSRVAHRLPRGNDGELRNPVEQRELRRFKMGRRLKTFDFADKFAGGLCGGSERRRRECRAPRNQGIPIILRRLSNG
jgi:hypothetical protein